MLLDFSVLSGGVESSVQPWGTKLLPISGAWVMAWYYLLLLIVVITTLYCPLHVLKQNPVNKRMAT